MYGWTEPPWMGPGPDEGHLDDDVVEPPGLEARQGRHLGAALHLEDADGVGGAQQVVDARVLLREAVERQLDALRLPHEPERVLERGEHPEAEEVELDEAGVGAVVLVPLEHRAARHARPLDRAHVDDGPVAEDHAAGVDAEVSRQPQEPLGEVEDRARGCGRGRSRGVALARRASRSPPPTPRSSFSGHRRSTTGRSSWTTRPAARRRTRARGRRRGCGR